MRSGRSILISRGVFTAGTPGIASVTKPTMTTIMSSQFQPDFR